MDFGSVPEASKTTKISYAFIVFLITGAIILTIYIVRYKIETENKFKELLKEKPNIEVSADVNQIVHIDESVHKLELENALFKNRITKIEAEVKWLRENCKCKD